MYEELLAGVPGVKVHSQPADGRFDSNYWLCTVTLDPDVRVKGQDNVYKQVITKAVGGAAGVLRIPTSPVTDCQPNDNIEAMRIYMDEVCQVEARPLWKPMHKQPVYCTGAAEVALDAACGCGTGSGTGIHCLEGPKMIAYTNGMSESLFIEGLCLPAGPCVSDDDVRYIVDCIKEAIEK